VSDEILVEHLVQEQFIGAQRNKIIFLKKQDIPALGAHGRLLRIFNPE
jgi:hypothetical protein